MRPGLPPEAAPHPLGPGPLLSGCEPSCGDWPGDHHPQEPAVSTASVTWSHGGRGGGAWEAHGTGQASRPTSVPQGLGPTLSPASSASMLRVDHCVHTSWLSIRLNRTSLHELFPEEQTPPQSSRTSPWLKCSVTRVARPVGTRSAMSPPRGSWLPLCGRQPSLAASANQSQCHTTGVLGGSCEHPSSSPRQGEVCAEGQGRADHCQSQPAGAPATWAGAAPAVTIVENLSGPFSGVTVRSQAMFRGGAINTKTSKSVTFTWVFKPFFPFESALNRGPKNVPAEQPPQGPCGHLGSSGLHAAGVAEPAQPPRIGKFRRSPTLQHKDLQTQVKQGSQIFLF